MQTMQSTVAILLALAAVPASGALLRGNLSAKPADPAAIAAKWDDMDSFVGTIFTMACKEKTGKDIAGLAAEKLKKGEISGSAGYAAEVKSLQAANVRGLKRTCGMTVSEGLKSCREGCAANWNAKTGFQRDNCDDKCVKVYDNFERSCNLKVENLANVFKQKREKEAAQNQCYRGHCSEFPAVWMKESVSDMDDELKKSCTSKCTSDKGAAHLKTVCEGKWAEKVEDSKAAHEAECAESTQASTCMAKKTKTISGAYDKCKKTKNGVCDKDFATCTKKGKTDKTFKDAASFCKDRKKMCYEQTNDGCSAEQKESLAQGQEDCEKVAADGVDGCVEKALAAEKAKDIGACEKADKKACSDKCAGGCKVGKMMTCLKHVEQDHVVPMFCDDFWHMLHTSSEIDPVTGNPIALLSQKARLTFGK